MADFPTLKKGPDPEDFVEEIPFDPTIRSNFENGAVLTRARFTSVPRAWKVVLRKLSESDKETLSTFHRETVLVGAGEFNWGYRTSSETFVVKFMSPIKFSIDRENPKLIPNTWKAEFTLVTA